MTIHNDIFRSISFIFHIHSYISLTHILEPILSVDPRFGVAVLEALKQAFTDRMSSQRPSLASLAKPKHSTAVIGKIITAVQAEGPLNARVWGLCFQHHRWDIFHQYLTWRTSSEKQRVYATPADKNNSRTRAAVGWRLFIYHLHANCVQACMRRPISMRRTQLDSY